MDGSLLVRGGRLVGLDGQPTRAADVRVRDGVVVEVGVGLASVGEPVLGAADGWVVPGLWDAHVHFRQWVRSTTWIELAGSDGPEQVCARVAAALAERPGDGRVATGFGYRSASWPRVGTVAELDAATGDRPVVLIAGDVHNGWVNSAALELAGLPPRRAGGGRPDLGALAENEWFAALARLTDLPGTAATPAEEASAVARLTARGLVGLVDLEFTDAFRDWPARVARGITSLRVRTGVYPAQRDAVRARGWRTGDALPGGAGLVTMGPLKIIADGSMGTRTAWCFEPYADASPHDPQPAGAPNLSPAELRALASWAADAGLQVAIHAIGDRANAAALDAFAATGAWGSIEHAQLLRRPDVPRFAALGVTASMQPHHLVADRDAAALLWSDRSDRLYLTRSLTDAGARLALGSDAPVSPPDPWITIATAVHRSGDDRPGWHAEESLTPREALAASVDGQRIAVGGRGDLVVIAADPLWQGPTPAATATHLRTMPVLATVCAGRPTHLDALDRVVAGSSADTRGGGG